MKSGDRDEHKWAFTESAPSAPLAHGTSELELLSDSAWRWLLLEHMPFHALDDRERSRLIEQLASLENELFRQNEGEANDDDVEGPAPTLPPVTDVEDESINQDVWAGIDTRVMSADTEGRRLAAKQARLMEQAFSVLRLDRYANAPINRGVMNLFRAWASTKTFDDLLKRSESVFSKPFLMFHKYYLRGLRRIDEDPIPHPWDRHVRTERPVFHLFAMRGTLEMHAEQKPPRPGIYLDSGIIEGAVDEKAQLSSASKDEPVKAKDELPPGAHA